MSNKSGLTSFKRLEKCIIFLPLGNRTFSQSSSHNLFGTFSTTKTEGKLGRTKCYVNTILSRIVWRSCSPNTTKGARNTLDGEKKKMRNRNGGGRASDVCLPRASPCEWLVPPPEPLVLNQKVCVCVLWLAESRVEERSETPLAFIFSLSLLISRLCTHTHLGMELRRNGWKRRDGPALCAYLRWRQARPISC